jgi:acetolactate decarboxylase
MKRLYILIKIFFTLAYLSAVLAAGNNTVYQVAPIKGLSAGLYDGFYPLAELKKNGDFGLGTFHALDGEMIYLDGFFYQVKYDGRVLKVPESVLTPFALVTFFKTDLTFKLEGIDSFARLAELLDRQLPSKNIFYALKIGGNFEYLKLRSVPAQVKPYPPLAEALKRQAVFEHRNVTGTLVGFRSPQFAEGVNAAGYHFHFISDKRDIGGHMLDLQCKKADVKAVKSSELILILPQTGDYLNAGLENPSLPSLKATE